MTKEDLEKASKGDGKDWFEEKCPKWSKMERQSVSKCRKNGVNLAIFAKGAILD